MADLSNLIMDHVPKPAARWGRRLILGVLTGMLAGLAAAALHHALDLGVKYGIGRFSHFEKGDLGTFSWAVILLPTVGCLLAGILAYVIIGGERVFGVEFLTRAFHRDMGEINMRSPLGLATGCTLVVASGGSAGSEGPIASFGAAIGSAIGRIFPNNAHERRILLVAGCAAGIGAIFRCPLGGALFATGVLYSEPEFESDAIVPSFVASVIGYSTFMLVLGYQGPMLEGVEGLTFNSPTDLIWYATLGLLSGLVGIFFFFCMKCVHEKLVQRIAIPIWLWPAIGGLITGLIACAVPQVMDGRFHFVQNALSDELTSSTIQSAWGWAGLFGLIVIAKCIATAFTVGSGAPGGMFGPSVFIGGVLGAFVGAVGEALFPDSFPPELKQALIPVGMAGVFAATMRTPLAAIVMIMEMTHSFGLIAPLMIVCVSSYVIGRRFGLNTEQVRTAADSPTHIADPIIHLLEMWQVRDLMQKDWPMTVPTSAGLDEIISQVEPGARPVIAVADDGELKGLISATDLGTVLEENAAAAFLIASEIMATNLDTIDDDDDVYSALMTFDRVDHATLPVMKRQGGHRVWVGMLTRKQIVDKLHEELERMHDAAFEEHPSLHAIQENVQIDQLMMGVSSAHADIQRLFVPIGAVGKSLRECDFRRSYNAQVIAIEEPDGSIQCPPALDTPLRTNQRLLAVLWKDTPKPPAE